MTDAAASAARTIIAVAVDRLTAAGARTETLAELRIPRRIGPITRAPRFTTIGRVWRLGVLLLAPDGDGGGRLFATGAVTRARDPRHPNFTSVSGEERREVREAARRSGFAAGQAIDYDAVPLPLDGSLGSVGPLVVRDGALIVSWNAGRSADSLTPFADYLAERVELLGHPPDGA
ncbi:MAG TPA: hypothetical protein VGM70_06585 [Pseudolysinimonas sp.]|jgi:hypothetical protein